MSRTENRLVALAERERAPRKECQVCGRPLTRAVRVPGRQPVCVRCFARQDEVAAQNVVEVWRD